MSHLTEEQRRHYDEQGFLLVPRLFGAAERGVWEQRFRDIVEGVVPPAKDMLVMRDVMVARGAVVPRCRSEAIAKIQDFHRDPVLFEGYVRNPKLVAWVEAFVGPDVKSIHNMLINKPPGVDGRHPLHQASRSLAPPSVGQRSIMPTKLPASTCAWGTSW